MENRFTCTVPRYYDLELPRPSPRRARWPLLIALHGYQGDKSSMMGVARRIGNGKMVVISLQGPHTFFVNYVAPNLRDPKPFRVGFGWGTTWKMDDAVALHHSNLRSLIELAVREHRADRRRVFLLAFSQACTYNYRFVFTHPRLVRGAIGVCGGVPGDWNENARYRNARTHVLHIAATQDVWYSREMNLAHRAKLAERAASLDFRFYKSTHRFPRPAIPHIRKWIEKHL